MQGDARNWWVAPIAVSGRGVAGMARPQVRKKLARLRPSLPQGLGVAVASEEGASAQKFSAGPMSQSTASIASLGRASISHWPITHATNRTVPPFRPLRPLQHTGGTEERRIGESDFAAQLGEEGPGHSRCGFGPQEGIASIHGCLHHRLPLLWLPAKPAASIGWLGHPLEQQSLSTVWRGEGPTCPPWPCVPRPGVWTSGGLGVPVPQPRFLALRFPVSQQRTPMRSGSTPTVWRRPILQRRGPRAFQKAGAAAPILTEPNTHRQSM